MCLHYTCLIFLNTASEPDKSYMMNHVVNFGLLKGKILKVQHKHAKLCIATSFTTWKRKVLHGKIEKHLAFESFIECKRVQYRSSKTFSGIIMFESCYQWIAKTCCYLYIDRSSFLICMIIIFPLKSTSSWEGSNSTTSFNSLPLQFPRFLKLFIKKPS